MPTHPSFLLIIFLIKRMFDVNNLTFLLFSNYDKCTQNLIIALIVLLHYAIFFYFIFIIYYVYYGIVTQYDVLFFY